MRDDEALANELHEDEVMVRQGDIPLVLRMDGIRVATLAVLALVVVSVVVLSALLLTSVRGQRETNECYQRQLVELTDWANAAAQASRTDRQAQRELLVSQATPGDGRAAFERYLAQLDEADRTRSTAPVPDQQCQ